MNAIQTDFHPRFAQNSEAALARNAVERHLDGGNTLGSGINAACNLADAMWTRFTELGLIDRSKSYQHGEKDFSDRIPDHEAYFSNGRVVSVERLHFRAASESGGRLGTINITNGRGNKISLEFSKDGLGRVLVDGIDAIGSDGSPKTMSFNRVIDQVARSYLEASRSDLAVSPEERAQRKLEEF